MAKARRKDVRKGLAAALALLAGCGEGDSGPVAVSAIGEPPGLVNPNLAPLDPPSAFLVAGVAQGLVRFDAGGEIEPALAQSWIVSDDGLRYTFRIRRSEWTDGRRVTAEQVAARLRAAVSRASRNPLKPTLGAIDEVVAMTDHVLEISLKGPRPNLLQLLAQPEMAIVRDGQGTGPYRIAGRERGLVRLAVLRTDDEEGDEAEAPPPDILLRGEPAASAVARFALDDAELVTGGTLGGLPFALAADLPQTRLVLDPAAGLLGLAFAGGEGALSDPSVRRAISMAIDRQALAEALAVPGFQPRAALLPPGLDELPGPTAPDWADAPMPMRRERAARVIAALDAPPRLRVATPEGPGYRRLFALLRRDWRLIGVEAERVGPGAPADLRLVDAVAPAALASWYLRHFACDTGRVCDAAADEALETARAASPPERRRLLAAADRLLTTLTPFVSLGSPVRWSLVSPRLTGFRPNRFAAHPPDTLIAERN